MPLDNCSSLPVLCSLVYYLAPQDTGPKACVWSLGCTLHALAAGEPPLADVSPVRARFFIEAPLQPSPELVGERFSADLKHFVRCCLVKDDEKRADTRQLLRHALLRYPLATFLMGTHAKAGAQSPIRAVLVGHALGSRHVLRVLKEFLDGAPSAAAAAATSKFEPAAKAQLDNGKQRL